MSAFQISLMLLLFLYDGQEHTRSEEEIRDFCEKEHICFVDLSYFLFPLFDRNHILIQQHTYHLQCTKKYSLRYYLILLYTYFEKKEIRN